MTPGYTEKTLRDERSAGAEIRQEAHFHATGGQHRQRRQLDFRLEEVREGIAQEQNGFGRFHRRTWNLERGASNLQPRQFAFLRQTK